MAEEGLRQEAAAPRRHPARCHRVSPAHLREKRGRMSAKRRERGAVRHARIVRDPKSPYWYAEFEVDGERFHKSTRQRDEAAAQAIADGWYNEAVAAAGRRRKTGIEPVRLLEAAQGCTEDVKF